MGDRETEIDKEGERGTCRERENQESCQIQKERNTDHICPAIGTHAVDVSKIVVGHLWS